MVIISSFYNEEYLLPWWCEHHKDIFERGVLFDYFSTDKSVEIIKDICPHWEVRKTRNKDWEFADNDEEFMDTEREFGGYKIVLTTTEFLTGKIPGLPFEKTCYEIPIVRMVDIEPDVLPTYDKPLLEQKNVGYLDTGNPRRFLHNHPDGRYDVGRHGTSLERENSDMLIMKYVYSPWNEVFINRKLDMATHLNGKDMKRGWGTHHAWSRKRMESEYQKALQKDLKEYES